MGLSDIKLHRFLSVPDDVLLCKKDTVSIDKEFTLKRLDSDRSRFNVRNKSVELHMKSNCSSGTEDIIPERLRFKNCVSDIDNGYIKVAYKFNCQTSDNKSSRKMTVLRDSRNRRRALGNIFQDTDREEIENITSVYENRINFERLGDYPADEISFDRRDALADIFQGVSDIDLERLLSLSETDNSSEVSTSGRRQALADIFANISEEQVRNIIRKCRVEIERSRSVDVPEIQTPRKCRRCAKGNIFDDVTQEDMQRILQNSETDIVPDNSEEPSVPFCRRFGLADIFHDISEDDLWRIYSMYEEDVDDETEKDDENEAATCGAVDRRRLALADIFKDVNEKDLINFLSEFCDNLEDEFLEQDTATMAVTRNRRVALGDIFCDVDCSELEHFRSRFGLNLEHFIEDDGL